MWRQSILKYTANIISKMVTKDWLINKFRLCRLRHTLNVFRFLYLVIATGVVCHGFINSYEKMREQRVLLKEEILVLDKMRYPSITFCYKYKHGSKEAVRNYYPYLFEKAKHEGTDIYLISCRVYLLWGVRVKQY